MILESFRLAGRRGPPVQGELRLPESAAAAPVIVFVNGLILSRDWGFYPYLAERLAQSGFAVLTYDSASSALESSPEEATVSNELEDLAFLLDGIGERRVPGSERCLPEVIGLFGHGKGGSVGLLHAVRDPRVRTLVTLAACSTFDRFHPGEVARIDREGHLEVPQPGTGRVVRISKAYLDDLREHRHRFSLEAALPSLRVPVAFIHGEEDHIVGVSESEALYHWSDKDRARLIVLEKTGHTLGAVHPFHGPNRDIERLVQICVAFFTENLAAGTCA
jgi:pimeloyl-ACP methyl ester carboxylesterase